MSRTETLHATCVALDRNRGLLVLGPSGSGKSALGLQLMAMGAHLIADDQTTLTVTDAGLVASCPSPIAGVIEARGIGLLTATPLPMARITLVADLGQTETDRLPPFRSVTLLGTVLPLVLGQKAPTFLLGCCAICMVAAMAEVKKVQPNHEPEHDHRLVLVTGPSGAGRSTAIHALEDLGYEAIDNLPLSLVPRLIDGPPLGRPVALGIDVRNREFSVSALIELIDGLTRDPRTALELLYLDCTPSELIRRYSQTRRSHPLAPGETPSEGIAREIELLTPIRARADHLIDTTEMSPHDLKTELARWFDVGKATGLAVSVQSFSYRRGVPRGVDMVFDCRFLKNPHWQPDLRALDGRDSAVADYVESDPLFVNFFQRLRDMVLFLLPAHVTEGRAHLTIGFGCTGGQHRSVAVAEKLGKLLAEAGWQVSKRHRELERRVGTTSPTHTG